MAMRTFILGNGTRSSGQAAAIFIAHLGAVSEVDGIKLLYLCCRGSWRVLYLWIGQHRALVSPLKAYIGRRWHPTSLHACAPLGAAAVAPAPSLLLHRHAGEAQGQNLDRVKPGPSPTKK